PEKERLVHRHREEREAEERARGDARHPFQRLSRRLSRRAYGRSRRTAARHEGTRRPLPIHSEVAHLPTNLADCLLLQLPNALTREVVLVANLFESQLVLVVESEA